MRQIAAVVPIATIATLTCVTATTAETVRFATFNTSMNRDASGELAADLAAGDDPQIGSVAEIVQRVDPDILLVNEFDYAPDLPQAFVDIYLSVPQNRSGTGPSPAVDYPHTFTAPSNTGVPSGLDLDNDGTVGGPGDAQGFGFFEGQFGMAVFSKHPIRRDEIRTFQTFLWADMPGARLPSDPEDADGDGDAGAWFTEAELDAVRLSSKSHWDVPIEIDGEVVHFLVSHPTPPVFDGPEDRNGLRNADEIRFWADYVAGADYIYDDAGQPGGLAPNARFVIAGDQNSDPFDGDSLPGAAQQILDSPLVQGSATDPAITPASAGGPDAAAAQDGANDAHRGDPAFDTADFGFNPDDPDSDLPPGNLRVDYVLPSVSGLRYEGGGVFWPPLGDPLYDLAAFPTSDHRLVYVDLAIVPQIPLPAGIWLMGGALSGLVLLRRRAGRH